MYTFLPRLLKTVKSQVVQEKTSRHPHSGLLDPGSSLDPKRSSGPKLWLHVSPIPGTTRGNAPMATLAAYSGLENQVNSLHRLTPSAAYQTNSRIAC